MVCIIYTVNVSYDCSHQEACTGKNTNALAIIFRLSLAIRPSIRAHPQDVSLLVRLCPLKRFRKQHCNLWAKLSSTHPSKVHLLDASQWTQYSCMQEYRYGFPFCTEKGHRVNQQQQNESTKLVDWGQLTSTLALFPAAAASSNCCSFPILLVISSAEDFCWLLVYIINSTSKVRTLRTFI